MKSFVFTMALLTTATVSQQSFAWAQFACRGGGNTLDASHRGGENWDIWVNFKKGDHGALSYDLEPGSCSWTDRAMAESDPAVIYFVATASIPQFRWTLGDQSVIQNPIKKIKFLSWLSDSSQYLVFNAEVTDDHKLIVPDDDFSVSLVPIR